MASFIRKVVMLGDPAVGKTSLVNRYVLNMFDEKYLTTIGAKPTKKIVDVGNDKVTLMIWDIAGHAYNSHPNYYTNAKGAILVCDLTKRSTLESLRSWRTGLYNTVGNVPVYVFANKSDLDDWEFNDKDLDSLGLDFKITSAKTGDNVEKAFNDLAGRIINGSRKG